MTTLFGYTSEIIPLTRHSYLPWQPMPASTEHPTSLIMAGAEGLEPATAGFGNHRQAQISK